MLQRLTIFNVVNTTMLEKGASIVQAGVQLMNYGSSWYSVQNVLEYFFWFKSRLRFHAKVGMIEQYRCDKPGQTAPALWGRGEDIWFARQFW